MTNQNTRSIDSIDGIEDLTNAEIDDLERIQGIGDTENDISSKPAREGSGI